MAHRQPVFLDQFHARPAHHHTLDDLDLQQHPAQYAGSDPVSLHSQFQRRVPGHAQPVPVLPHRLEHPGRGGDRVMVWFPENKGAKFNSEIERMKSYREQHIRLTDGRRISYDDVGAPDGKPVFYFHGVPSARVEWQMWVDETMLKQLGIRLIAPDRPGVGASTFQPGRRLSDWPFDVTALADGLGLQKFSVLGYSGGGPYAAVCAHQIPERLISTALASSLAPFDLPGVLEGVSPDNVQFLQLSRQQPWLFRLLYGQIGLLTRYAPRQFLKRALATFEAADRMAFARPDVHSAIFAARGSRRGQQVDTALIIGPWDFELEEIAIPVQLWQGEQDHNASPEMFHHLAETIPETHPRLIPGEGHISLIVNHAQDILKELI